MVRSPSQVAGTDGTVRGDWREVNRSGKPGFGWHSLIHYMLSQFRLEAVPEGTSGENFTASCGTGLGHGEP
ncbi:hypothetical protein O9H85_09480 [Paenibacillus filicis]|uniref:Uncharacterized protein n=1 Tax=Paenibacillus gyeongsangnamensis TaxID=3388067 RepID=A0ABT4Q6Y7_9BACL|nr:hypothetical protein [Paenibacillus filicis]MCZ8512640.1 hypothetical protein [Paenibacillus filicis]